MDAIVQKHINQSVEEIKTNTPWQLDRPHDQKVFRFANGGNNTNGQSGEWLPLDLQSSAPHIEDEKELDHISIMSWNIDFMVPWPDSRMAIGLGHLEELVELDAKKRDNAAYVVFLAECTHSDLKLIAAHPWVRQRFFVTDLDDTNWGTGYYGTTMLVDRRLHLTKCFRVHYSLSRMQRDGLFVEILMGAQKQKVRLCNTHLESLALEPPYRPAQLKTCAEFMKSDQVQGAILAGDLNAIQPFDRTLHSDNGLKDAYLEMGGSEEDPEGHTWGQQAATEQRKRFGTCRMDKILYRGALSLHSFHRFGQDVELVDPEERKHVMGLGFDKPWITDHLGVMASFSISKSAQTML